MGDNRITGDISTDPLAAKSRTVSADEVKIDEFNKTQKHGNYRKLQSSGQSSVIKLTTLFVKVKV